MPALNLRQGNRGGTNGAGGSSGAATNSGTGGAGGTSGAGGGDATKAGAGDKTKCSGDAAMAGTASVPWAAWVWTGVAGALPAGERGGDSEGCGAGAVPAGERGGGALPAGERGGDGPPRVSMSRSEDEPGNIGEFMPSAAGARKPSGGSATTPVPPATDKPGSGVPIAAASPPPAPHATDKPGSGVPIAAASPPPAPPASDKPGSATLPAVARLALLLFRRKHWRPPLRFAPRRRGLRTPGAAAPPASYMEMDISV